MVHLLSELWYWFTEVEQHVVHHQKQATNRQRTYHTSVLSFVSNIDQSSGTLLQERLASVF